MSETKNINLTQEQLQTLFDSNLTTREIGKMLGVTSSTVSYWSRKLGCVNYRSKPIYITDYFHKIDTKQKAYIIGFLLGDSCLTADNKLTLSLAIKDKEILDFFVQEFGGIVTAHRIFDKKKKIFPHVTMRIGNNQIIRDIKMLFGGRLKEERHIPIIKKELEPYLVQGFFDAEGCISFGHKKNRDQFWAKITFTSQLKMLTGIQNILFKNGITTKIYPKSNEKCFVIEIRAKDNLNKMLDFIYSDKDFIILKRKYEKAVALRLELGENGESHK